MTDETHYYPVVINMNDQPRIILEGMDALLAQQERGIAFYQSRRKIPLILFLVGIPFALVDLALIISGYFSLIFSVVTLSCWIAALVYFIRLRRAGTTEFSPTYHAAREVIYTLRDDVYPKKNFFGKLDLTGPMQESKVAREATNSFGLVTQYYRDEWLSLKMKLYDGSLLRLAAIQRVKQRKGYWKRGSISGKSKWKPPKFKGSLQELRVRITANPELYTVTSSLALAPRAQIGAYWIEEVQASDWIVSLTASTGQKEIAASDILSVLQAAYGLLRRKAPEATG